MTVTLPNPTLRHLKTMPENTLLCVQLVVWGFYLVANPFHALQARGWLVGPALAHKTFHLRKVKRILLCSGRQKLVGWWVFCALCVKRVGD